MRAPEALGPGHDVSGFDCGVAALDDWLRRGAAAPAGTDIIRTYVACEGRRVCGYYSLAAGSVEAMSAEAGGDPPEPIFAMVISRLAVDINFQRQGLGRALLRDAILRIQNAAQAARVNAILVHALDDEAARFYRWNGFRPSPLGPLVLMLP